jgi:mono/diheme cytochrome c family protein
MKTLNVILVILLLIIAIIGLAAVSMLHNGLSARAKPTEMEAMLAREARHMAIPKDARKQQNPVEASEANLRDARLHFADHCAFCHANDGGGDTMLGNGLYPKPPDLRKPETQKLSDGEIFWIIENGVRFTGMPAFGGTHGSADTRDSGSAQESAESHGPQEDSWKLVRFIRHLPQLTVEERLEMERYNPKGPEDRAEEQEEEDFLKGAPVPQKPEATHHHH